LTGEVLGCQAARRRGHSCRLLLDARCRVQLISVKANSNEAGNQQQHTGRDQTTSERHSGTHQKSRAMHCAKRSACSKINQVNNSGEAVGRPASGPDGSTQNSARP
jgi:hypothetical protein